MNYLIVYYDGYRNLYRIEWFTFYEMLQFISDMNEGEKNEKFTLISVSNIRPGVE
jgi:hypothetical protein